jgi:hypothetical protein
MNSVASANESQSGECLLIEGDGNWKPCACRVSSRGMFWIKQNMKNRLALLCGANLASGMMVHWPGEQGGREQGVQDARGAGPATGVCMLCRRPGQASFAPQGTC